jgi:hypothetical protein
MRGVGLERQIAELVDDQQLGLGEEAEPLLELRTRVRPFELIAVRSDLHIGGRP